MEVMNVNCMVGHFSTAIFVAGYPHVTFSVTSNLSATI